MKMRTLNEAAEELGLKRHLLRKGITDGRYPSMVWGNRRLVDVDQLRPIVEAERRAAEAHEGLIGLRECAGLVGLTPDTLRRMTKAGYVPFEKSGPYYRYHLADVEAALREHMKQ